jgi:hypothetical protein
MVKVDLGTIPAIVMNGALTAGIVFIILFVYFDIQRLFNSGALLLCIGLGLYVVNVIGFSGGCKCQ